ncbi:hypothetical protein [Devosia sp.]|uniref:hypothetical protein n=1 Tax=Devosia sp. TaxID=1871048 RepID=UPI002EE32CB4
MPNAALIVETALLLLAAFLAGCVLGYGLRRLTLGRAAAATAPAPVAPEAPPSGPDLVVAPTIAPLVAPPPATPAAAVMQPARVAGQTTSGKLVPAPVLSSSAALAASAPPGPPEAELQHRLDAESELAAMRAIEGNWTPRAAPRAGHVELPEPIAGAAAEPGEPPSGSMG